MALPDEVYVCPTCWAADRAPGMCEHAGAKAMAGGLRQSHPPTERDGPFVLDRSEDVSAHQAARMLGVTVMTVTSWIRSGHIKAEKVGPAANSRWRIPRAEISRLRRGDQP